jgi:basic amino acid/polyamine antiporter, APA family
MPRPILRQTPAINTIQPVEFWRQIFLALSLMMGAGVFVGLGIAIEIAGAGIIGAVTLAALLAWMNQTVFTQPLAPTPSERLFVEADWQHFIVNWTLFLSRLTAAATAALGLAGYLQGLRITDPIWLMPTSLTIVVALTVISFRRPQSPRATPQVAITAILTILALLGLVLVGLPGIIYPNPQNPSSLSTVNAVPGMVNGTFGTFANLLQATALMSVAYASEQNAVPVQTVNPRQILKAHRFALVFTWLLYLGVTIVSWNTLKLQLNNGTLNEIVASVAPLLNVMQNQPLPGGVYLVTLGAVAGMTGVATYLLPHLTDSLLELSRNPTLLSTLLATGQPPEIRLSPRLAQLLVSIALGCIVLVGEVRTIWSFSAFTFLLSAALMHSIALRRRNSATYPHWRHWLGLIICLFLAFWVNWDVWLVSLGLIALALIWRGVQYWSDDP